MNLRASERTAVDIEGTEGPDHGRASARALIYDLSQDGCMIEFVGRNAGLQFVERLDKTKTNTGRSLEQGVVGTPSCVPEWLPGVPALASTANPLTRAKGKAR